MQRFNTLLQHPTMQAYASHNQELATLMHMWQQVAPAALIKLTAATQIKNQRLVVMCANNTIAAKIKLLSPSLLIQLQNQGYELTAIQPKVQVKSTPEVKLKAVRLLSPHGADMLNKLAEQQPNTPLSNAVAKILRNAKS